MSGALWDNSSFSFFSIGITVCHSVVVSFYLFTPFQILDGAPNSFPDEVDSVWNDVKSFFEGALNSVRDIVSDNLENLRETLARKACGRWDAADSAAGVDFSDVQPPPCTLTQARADARFVPDPACNSGNGCRFHPGAYHCVRSRIPRLVERCRRFGQRNIFCCMPQRERSAGQLGIIGKLQQIVYISSFSSPSCAGGGNACG